MKWIYIIHHLLRFVKDLFDFVRIVRTTENWEALYAVEGSSNNDI